MFTMVQLSGGCDSCIQTSMLIAEMHCKATMFWACKNNDISGNFPWYLRKRETIKRDPYGWRCVHLITSQLQPHNNIMELKIAETRNLNAESITSVLCSWWPDFMKPHPFTGIAPNKSRERKMINSSIALSYRTKFGNLQPQKLPCCCSSNHKLCLKSLRLNFWPPMGAKQDVKWQGIVIEILPAPVEPPEKNPNAQKI